MRYLQLLGILLLLTANNAFSQLNKGNIFLAGSTNSSLTVGSGGSSGNGGNSKFDYTKITFSPLAGYFVVDKLPVGFFFDLKYENLYNQEKSRTIEYGTFARFYILKTAKFNPYLEGRIGFGNSISKYNWSNIEATGKIFSGKFGAGCTFLLNQSVGLDLMLAYDYKKTKSDSSSPFVPYTIRTYKTNNFTINIGIVVLLGKKE